MTNDPLQDELDRVLRERKQHDMGQTVAALRPLLEKHPNDARVLFEVADAFDVSGEPALARIYYRRALDNGASGDLRRRCLLQLSATLSTLGLPAESGEAIAQAREEFPQSVAVGAFAALSLPAEGRRDAAIGSLIMLLTDLVTAEELVRYKPELRATAEYLISLDLATDR